MTLTIGHGNGHNKPSLVEFIKDADADSFGGDESHRLDLDIPGHRTIRAGEAVRDPRGSGSCSIVTRNTLENLGELTLKVSERIPGLERIAPDRMLVASFFAHPVADQLDAAGVAHFELHPDATAMRHDASHPITREYREALISTREYMRVARRDGYLLVLTGDLQANARFRAPWGPREVIANPLQLQSRVVHIDWIMVDAQLRFTQPLQTRRLFDHTGFVATLAARNA